jgi:hypothetical protein
LVSSEGRELLKIDVGGLPGPAREFRGATGVALRLNGPPLHQQRLEQTVAAAYDAEIKESQRTILVRA